MTVFIFLVVSAGVREAKHMAKQVVPALAKAALAKNVETGSILG